MGKTITIDDDAYNLLVSLKQGAGDSFTKVIRRHVHKPLENAGELLDAWEELPPPKVNLKVLDRIVKERGRRSGRRKS
jgi:predicted CopG family antitoxin